MGFFQLPGAIGDARLKDFVEQSLVFFGLEPGGDVGRHPDHLEWPARPVP